MSFRSWWLENRLRRTDAKLRQLRARQKRLREEEAELVKARKNGLAADEVATREARLHAEKERLAAEIVKTMAEEDALKSELREMGVTLASH